MTPALFPLPEALPAKVYVGARACLPVEPREDERYEDKPPSGQRRGGGGIYSQTGLSGPGTSGYMDLSPDTGIPGLGWLGIVAAGIVVAALIWQWFFI